MGSQSLFPGWEYARASSSLSVSPFSNVGPAVDIFAAGAFIMGAWFRDPFINTDPNITSSYTNYRNYDPNYVPTHPSLSLDEYMYSISGTSMAAPQIAGIACLYFQLNPGATAKQFKQFLSSSAIKTPQMQIFSEDPENNHDYTGSMFFTLLKDNYYTKSQTIALNGSPTIIAHWPYSNPNPFTTT
jgi:subtilisin family serine protease